MKYLHTYESCRLSSFTLEFPLPRLNVVSLSNFICNLKKAQGFQARMHVFFHFFNRFHEMTKSKTQTKQIYKIQEKTNLKNQLRRTMTKKCLRKQLWGKGIRKRDVFWKEVKCKAVREKEYSVSKLRVVGWFSCWQWHSEDFIKKWDFGSAHSGRKIGQRVHLCMPGT